MMAVNTKVQKFMSTNAAGGISNVQQRFQEYYPNIIYVDHSNESGKFFEGHHRCHFHTGRGWPEGESDESNGDKQGFIISPTLTENHLMDMCSKPVLSLIL